MNLYALFLFFNFNIHMINTKWVAILLAMMLIFGCGKDDSEEKRFIDVKTTAAISVTNTSVNSGGTIATTSSEPITLRGICWGLLASPTISGNKVEAGSGTGDFTCTVTGLQPRTNYHLRAYAVCSDETVYGDDILFTTLDNDMLPVEVKPLLKTNWTVFTWPYNAMYPSYIGTNAIHGKYPAPCGPTSLSRILAYWKGKITASGTIDATTTMGDARFTVKLDTIAVNYNNLPLSLSGTDSYNTYKDAAKIFLIAGSVSLTNYVDVGTPGDAIINGFKKYFNVSDNVMLIKRWEYSKSDWIKLLKTELAAGRPLMIAARKASSPAPGQPGNVEGHWFNIEGYNSEDLFFINYNYQGVGFKGYYDVDSFGEYCNYGLVVAGFEPK
jgi:hypothetical protein